MTPSAWTQLDERDAGRWDAFVTQFDDASLFQSIAWAEHRRESGHWTAERWRVSGSPGRAAIQLLLRRVLGVTIAWAPGGPLVDPVGSDPGALVDLLHDLFALLKARHTRLYVRLDAPASPASSAAIAFARTCARPAVRLNTDMTLMLDLTPDPTLLLARMTKHHRYEVRRALSHGIEWRLGCDPAEIDALVALHGEMTRRKGIRRAPQARRATISSLCARFRDRALVLVGSSRGRAVTACFVLTFAGRAFFHTAATGAAGLRCGASYAAVHELALLLAQRGVRELDLGGLDTRGALIGVARFKEGFGGRVVERTGEWQWASHPMIAAVAELGVALRRGALGG